MGAPQDEDPPGDAPVPAGRDGARHGGAPRRGPRPPRHATAPVAAGRPAPGAGVRVAEPPWEEQANANAHAHGALSAPRSGDEEITPWWRRSPSAVTPPVYPHVERSPSPPIARGWPADDDERQERGEPSGSPAMAPPVRHAPHVEQSTPVPIKSPAAEAVCMPSGSPAMAPPVQPAPHVEQSTPLPAKEPAAVAKVEADAIVQTAANADADQALLGKGATPGGKGCIGQKGEEGDFAIDGHGRQLLGEMNVSKSTEQPKPTESISGGHTDELVQKRYQDNKPADQEIATLDKQKRVGSNDEVIRFRYCCSPVFAAFSCLPIKNAVQIMFACAHTPYCHTVPHLYSVHLRYIFLCIDLSPAS